MTDVPKLDRRDIERNRGDEREKALDAPTTRFVLLWRGQILTRSESIAFVPSSGRLLDEARELAWLGRLGDGGSHECFAADISHADEPISQFGLDGQFGDLRLMAHLSRAAFDLAAYAKGLLHWHTAAAFCGRCGEATRPKKAGHMRVCPQGHEQFPRTDPAVMLLIRRGEYCLLGRQPIFPQGMYSALAGFVEPGESLEDAARREALEEVGVPVNSIQYFRSQAWPFPASLMLGFFADTTQERIEMEDDELEEARWFHRSELQQPDGFFIPPKTSLAHYMIRAFANGEDG